MATIPRPMMGLPNSPSFRYKALNPAYQSDPRRILGQQLMQQGSSSAPVQTPLQGLGRLSSALVGAYLQKGAVDRQVAREDERTKQIMGMIPANATPQMRSFAEANPEGFMSAYAQNIFQPTTSSSVVNLGGNLRGVQTTTTNPFGRSSQAITNLTQITQPSQTTAQKNALALGYQPGTNEYTDYIKTVTAKSNKPQFITIENNQGNQISLPTTDPRLQGENSLLRTGYVIKDTAGTNVKVDMGKVQTQQDIELAKLGAKTLEKLQTDVIGDNEMLSRLDIAQTLLAGGIQTGPLEEITMPLRQLGRSLGFLNDEQSRNLSGQEILRSSFAYLIPRMRVPGSGATSDFEASLFAQATAGMGNTPEANIIKVKGLQLLAQEKKKVLKAMSKFYKANASLVGFADEYDKTRKPLFSNYSGADANNLFDKDIADKKLVKGDMYYNGEQQTFEILGVTDADVLDDQTKQILGIQ